MESMNAPNRTIRQTPARPEARPETVLLPVKITPDLRRRFRMAAVARDFTYAQLIEYWLDQDADKVARLAKRQAHPLHRPTPASAYPGGSHQ